MVSVYILFFFLYIKASMPRTERIKHFLQPGIPWLGKGFYIPAMFNFTSKKLYFVIINIHNSW